MTMQETSGEIWAQMYTVGPRGYADSDGDNATDISADVARNLASQEGQLTDVMWVNFDVNPNDERPHDVLWDRVGESMIATSRRTHSEVVFRPVSEVLESGRVTKYTARWLGRLANGE